jgi:acyl-CoA synthetase (AMP-forming)/AMP-acid ligase II
MSIGLVLDLAVGQSPERAAVGTGAHAITFEGLDRLAGAAAARFLESGAGCVAFVGLAGPSFHIAMFAAARAGLPLVPLNYRLHDSQLSALLDSLDAPVVVVDRAFRTRIDAGTTVVGSETLLEATAAAAVTEPVDVDSEQPAVILFTSGTTAAPKGVVLKHRHLVSYVLQTVDPGSAGAQEAALVSLPPYHVAGVGTVLTNTLAGRRVVHCPDFAPEAWLDLVRTERVTAAMVVPTMLTRIVEHLDGRSAQTPTLRSLAYGGARVSPPVLLQALQAFPDTDFVNAYGLTETSSTIALLGPQEHREALAANDPQARARLSSAGRFVPGIEGQVRDADGLELPTGHVGELWVRGPQVSGEYLGHGSAVDADGWFSTRDRAHLDADGFLFIEGRTDDTIIRGGENIAPAEIENVLAQHPEVRDVAVVGAPDDEWGERLVAVVVLRPATGEPVKAQDLQDFVRIRLRGSRTPDDVVFREGLPRTPTGKLLRRDLVKMITTRGLDKQ